MGQNDAREQLEVCKRQSLADEARIRDLEQANARLRTELADTQALLRRSEANTAAAGLSWAEKEALAAVFTEWVDRKPTVNEVLGAVNLLVTAIRR